MAKSRKNNLNSFEGIFFGENEEKAEVKDTIAEPTKQDDITQEKPKPEQAKMENETPGELKTPIEVKIPKETKTPKEKKIPKELKKRGRPKTNREIKKRITFTLLQSNYDKASKVAYIEGKSVSQVVGDFLLDYINQNQDKILEYNNLTNK